MRALLAILSLVFVAALSEASPWGGGGCPEFQAMAPAPVSYTWRLHSGTDDQYDLFRNGVCVGSWFADLGAYYGWNGSSWSEATVSPVTIPASIKVVTRKENKYFFGANITPSDGHDHFKIGKQEVTYRQAWQAIKGEPVEGIVDDTKKCHVTAIGRDREAYDALCTEFLTSKASEALKECRVQVYDISRKIDAEMLAPYKMEGDERFKKRGRVVVVSSPQKDGEAKVLFSVYDTPTAESVVEGLRRLRPDWDPNKVPPQPKPNKTPANPDSGPQGPSYEVSLAPLVLPGLALTGASVYYRRKCRKCFA